MHSTTRRRASVVVAVLVLALLAACGQNSGTSQPSSTSTTSTTSTTLPQPVGIPGTRVAGGLGFLGVALRVPVVRPRLGTMQLPPSPAGLGATLASTQIAYRQFGSGPNLLLVMGEHGTMTWWDPQLLSALAGQFTVTIFDLPGVGYSQASPRRPTLDTYADLTAGLAAALGLETNGVAVLGWGLGGDIALDAELRHPGFATSLVLAETPAPGTLYVAKPQAAAAFASVIATTVGLSQLMFADAESDVRRGLASAHRSALSRRHDCRRGRRRGRCRGIARDGSRTDAPPRLRQGAGPRPRRHRGRAGSRGECGAHRTFGAEGDARLAPRHGIRVDREQAVAAAARAEQRFGLRDVCPSGQCPTVLNVTTEEPPASPEPPRAQRDRRGCRGSLLLPLGVAVFAGLSTTWLDVIARHATNANSDGATVVLEGQAMSAGHLLLAGWSLSLDSFWTVDVPFYAVAIRLTGVTRNLIFTVPSVIAALVFLVSALLTTGRQHGLGQSSGCWSSRCRSRSRPGHFRSSSCRARSMSATTLWVLLAFALVSGNRFDWRWGLAICLLVAGALGDFQTAALGMVPVLLSGLLAADIAKSWRKALPLLSAPIVAIVAYYAIREAAKRIGTFTIARANSISSPHQSLANLEHLPRFLWGLAWSGERDVRRDRGLEHAPGLRRDPLRDSRRGAARCARGDRPSASCGTAGRRWTHERRDPGLPPHPRIRRRSLDVRAVADHERARIRSLPDRGHHLRHVACRSCRRTALAPRSRNVTIAALGVALVVTGTYTVAAFDEGRGNPVYHPRPRWRRSCRPSTSRVGWGTTGALRSRPSRVAVP